MALALAAAISRSRFGFGPDRGNVDQRIGTGRAGGGGDIGRAVAVDGVEIALQYADEIDDRVGPLDRMGDRGGLGDTGRHELRLAEAAETCKVAAAVMEQAAEPAVALSVPLVVEARAAANWDEAH